VLHGDFLGHPLHPALVTIPIGAWSCGLALDFIGLLGGRGFRLGADAVCALGLAGALGAAVTGLADWSTTRGGARRVGFVHGATNLVVVGFYGASLLSRAVGLRGIGVALSTTGYALVGFSGWLGGELIYRHGVGLHPEACERQEGVRAPDAGEGEHDGHL
jgi:uncharacterized membrane protein